jgi:hypothetical protein
MKTNPNFRMPNRGLFEDSQYPQKNELWRQWATHNIKTQAYVATSIRF